MTHESCDFGAHVRQLLHLLDRLYLVWIRWKLPVSKAYDIRPRTGCRRTLDDGRSTLVAQRAPLLSLQRPALPDGIQRAHEVLVRTDERGRALTCVPRGVAELPDVGPYRRLRRKQSLRDRRNSPLLPLQRMCRRSGCRCGRGKRQPRHPLRFCMRRTGRHERGWGRRRRRARAWLAVAFRTMLDGRVVQVLYRDIVLAWQRPPMHNGVLEPLRRHDRFCLLRRGVSAVRACRRRRRSGSSSSAPHNMSYIDTHRYVPRNMPLQPSPHRHRRDDHICVLRVLADTPGFAVGQAD